MSHRAGRAFDNKGIMGKGVVISHWLVFSHPHCFCWLMENKLLRKQMVVCSFLALCIKVLLRTEGINRKTRSFGISEG